MSDAVQPQSLSDDIAFVRALAEEGRKTPYRGGVSLAAGLIWGSTSLYCWTVTERFWDPPGGLASIGWIWGVAAILFAAAGFPLGMYQREARTNRVAAAAWGGVGLASWTIFAATALAIWRTHAWMIGAFMPSMIMALYGAGWMVGSVAFRAPWQRWIGIACLLVALLLGATVGQTEEYLIFAVALYGLMGLPGLFAVMRAGVRS